MAGEEKAPWIMDFDMIADYTFNIQVVLEDIKKGTELRKKDLELIDKYFNAILKRIRLLAKSIIQDKTMEKVKTEVAKRVITCQDIITRAIGKVDSLTVLKGIEFQKQLNSLIKDCKEILATVEG